MTEINRRAAIVDAAWKLFSDFGYKATTIEQIAREAAICKGTVYNYFSTKEDVLFAIVDQAGAGMAALADSFLADARSGRYRCLVDPVPALVRAFISSVIFRRENYGLYRDLVAEAKAFGSPKVAEAVARLDSRFESEVARILAELAAIGLVGRCECRITACAMIQAYSALIALRDDSGKPLSGEVIADAIGKMLSGGLLAPIHKNASRQAKQ